MRWREGIVPLSSTHVGPRLNALSTFGPPVQEIRGQTKADVAETIMAVGAGALALCRQTEGTGPVQLGGGTFRGEEGFGVPSTISSVLMRGV